LGVPSIDPFITSIIPVLMAQLLFLLISLLKYSQLWRLSSQGLFRPAPNGLTLSKPVVPVTGKPHLTAVSEAVRSDGLHLS
jgi:hypothetical protein